MAGLFLDLEVEDEVENVDWVFRKNSDSNQGVLNSESGSLASHNPYYIQLNLSPHV